MNIKRASVIASLIIAALVLSTPEIYAAGQYPPGEDLFKDKMEAKRQQLYKDLGLSLEQQRLLEENKAKNKEKVKSLFKDLAEKRGLMRDELQKSELNMDAVNKANSEIKQLQAQMLDYKLESILEVRRILTSGQFKKFIEKMDKRVSRFKQKQEEPKDAYERD